MKPSYRTTRRPTTCTLGLRVCEQCSLVFKGRSRTRRCPSCNRAPVIPTVCPVAAGGWHLDVRVGGYWADNVFDRTVTYTGVCQHCTRRFSTNDPRGRYCENCKSPSGRQRRRRASRSTTGQTAVSYRSAEGSGPLLSVGVAGPDGNGVNLEAVNGVVTVTDLEYVRQLDANPAVRQVVAIPRTTLNRGARDDHADRPAEAAPFVRTVLDPHRHGDR